MGASLKLPFLLFCKLPVDEGIPFVFLFVQPKS